jgi:hypothetical protein
MPSRRAIQLSILTLVAWLGFAAPLRAECGHERISISGTPVEAAEACRALDAVLGYFRDVGVVVEPAFELVFKDRVVILLPDLAGSGVPRPTQVSGYYDAARRRLEVTTAKSPHKKDRSPWSIAWGPEIAFSILQHELVHMVVYAHLGMRAGQLSGAWHEYIAFAVQLDLMPASLRRRILDSHPTIQAFEHPEWVNPIHYAMDPDAFAIRAYRHAEANGGRGFIRRLLRQEVDFSTRELLWSK